MMVRIYTRKKLRERQYRIGASVGDLEDHGKFRDNENILDALVDVAQNDLPFPICVRGVCRNQRAYCCRIHIRYLAQVDNQFLVPLLDGFSDRVPQFISLFASNKRPFRFDDENFTVLFCGDS
jgi:hypothetical protein